MNRSTRQRGVSLLEALVAMAVMAVGAVAVVGLQATLRTNGDLAKQRSEAMRLAQEPIEDFRGFQSLDPLVGAVDWGDIQAINTAGIVGSSASFTRDVAVVESGANTDEPLSKTVHVRVTWQDRSGQDQSVTLNTVIAGVHPELAGTLSISQDKSPMRTPGGRHPAIPRSAVDLGNGTSRFNPPGAGTQSWVFSNTTGLIIQLCSDADTCSDIRGMLLSGFVRFSTGMAQPTSAQAESPTSATLPVAVTLNQTSPYNTAVNCFEEFATTSVAYFCLVQVNIVTTYWSGTVEISGIPLADDIDDDDDDKYKVCRYTTVRDNSVAAQQSVKNIEHPLHYVDVGKNQKIDGFGSLTNQNYLVIRAGNDDDPYVCPNDNASTPNLNGSTWHHQPAT